ncbi:MAG: ATP-binding cassette domain-containing protein, partial [Muribaculaceae bacterium]|nr:ATP-binding cassette domain-containing protein [Muribaculaceae bacterium]
VARNGTGKSTFLRILAGREDYDSGRITFAGSLRVAWLEQTPEFRPGATVLEAALEGDGPLAETVRRYIRALDHGTAAEQAAATQRVDAEHAWDYEDRLRQLLTRLGLTDMNAPVDKLSGGQRKRLALARVVMQEADLIILDEPTNHLDIPVIEWFEGYLRRARATLIMVTHDRYFLDNVCNRIIEIDRCQAYSYDGNYDYYLQKREEREENMSAELAKVKNLLRTEREWMRRQPQARGSKAKYRIDNFHQLEAKSRVDLSRRDVELTVKSAYIGSKIFEARDVKKAFGEKKILNGWSYDFARYEKVGIVGDNGAGKSTFIKLLLGELQPDSGHFDIGETVKWGYYSQEGMTDFDDRKKVIDAVREIAETVRIDDKTTMTASAFLSKFLFTPQQQQKYIAKLSGGERRRLYLATVLMRNPNFLILDEPTNDLDIMTLAVLEDYLVNFKGCVIVVSHDRFFLDRIVDHLFVFKGDGEVRDFPGDYSTYRHCVAEEEKERKELERKEREEKERKSGVSSATSSTGSSRRQNPPKVKLSFKEKREKEELEKILPELEKEKSELEIRMSSGEMSPQEIVEAGEKMAALIDRIDEGEMRLLELMEKEEGNG